MLPSTASRVAENTPAELNRRIRRQTEANLAYFAEHPDEIEDRLIELDEEWDIERVLEANASGLALTGVVLGSLVDRRFLLLPAAVTGFLLQHALQGWCPPIPLLRRIGIRTAGEIDEERFALKLLRGDFKGVAQPNGSARTRARQALEAARA